MPSQLEPLAQQAEALLPELVALRRKLHAAPELGLDCPETQRTLLEQLEDLGLEISTGMAQSGIVAVLRGEQPGATILLRADMDALPLQEDTGLDFASTHERRMHACGHDAHMAMLVGAARLLATRRDHLAGQVKFVFQPGEEGHGGARIMLEEGLLQQEPQVDAAFAIHVNPKLASGRVVTRPGPILASTDVFGIEVVGKGGHASMPHEAADPMPVACEIVLALQSWVTRRVDAFDPVVLTVTQMHAGTTHNIIPASVRLSGTLRAVSQRAREHARGGIKQVAEGVASAHGMSAEVRTHEGYPVTVNHAGFADFTQQVAGDLLGEDAVALMPAPLMGGEDFSYLLQKVPGAMVFLGVSPPGGKAEPLHSNRMILDEAAMAKGAALHAAMAVRYLTP